MKQSKALVKTFCDLHIDTLWVGVLNKARKTVGKAPITNAPSQKFKENILMSKHSPIRALIFEVHFDSIPSHITQQFSRHHIALDSNPNVIFTEDINPVDFEHYVKTSRSDRTGIPRNERKQDDPVSYQFTANAQGLMDASKKRLCLASDKDAIKNWKSVKDGISVICPELADRMQPSCVCYGFCPEDSDMVKCQFTTTEAYAETRRKYIKKQP
jgi:hypothetical protein